MILSLDFETFSACDLKSEGLDNYAKHPSTGVHCMAFAFDDEPVQDWIGPEYQSNVCRALAHVDDGGLVYAHNAAFELAIWNNVCALRYGWPELKPEQVRCTMAMGYAMSLPGSLEALAPALGIDARKDAAGKRIMLQLCRPKADGSMWKPSDDPAKFQKLYDYCKQDVEVERACHRRMMELIPFEQDLWALDYKINQRGVRVDLESARKLITLVEDEKARLNARMMTITGGVVGAATEVQLLGKWIKLQGVDMAGLTKASVLDALDGDLPENVREALEIRREAAKTSTAKVSAMLERASSDGRLRNLHQYHGAGTGRWAGRGVQIQNLARTRSEVGAEGVEEILGNLHRPRWVEAFYGPTMTAVSDCLRGLLVPSAGHDFCGADLSNIEGRVLAWLAGEAWKLQAFRDYDAGTGPDIYKLAYSRSFGVPVSSVTGDQRQVGKIQELALGFGGGVGAFQSMAKNYGVKIPDSEADEIKKAWREAHPAIVRFWDALDRAAMKAVETGQVQRVGACAFRKAGSFLWCRLPSGRALCYPYPEIRSVTTPWGDERDALTFMSVVDPNRKAKALPDPTNAGTWMRTSTYGGSLAENLTQAVARDLLACAMVRADARGFPVVMHVHDELVTETPESAPESVSAELVAAMCKLPPWATGLPIAAKAFRAKRYQK